MKKNNIKALIIIILVTSIENILYFLVKLLQKTPYLIGNTIDKKIPFIEYFVYFYVIWYLMLIIVPYIFYKNDKKDLIKYISLYSLCSITANIIFIIYPTIIERASIMPNTITKQIVNLIYYFDTPALNCFPSMHCIVSFIFILIAIESKTMTKNKKIIITSLSTLVILSTLFIKQHVLYDVIGALIIVLIYSLIYLKIKDKIEKKLERLIKD